MSSADLQDLFTEQGTLLLLLLGGLLFVFTLISGTSTLAGCNFGNGFGNGFYGTVYQIFGVYLPEVTVNISLTEFRFIWYDGCNSHSNSLLWPIGSALAVGSGVALHMKG